MMSDFLFVLRCLTPVVLDRETDSPGCSNGGELMLSATSKMNVIISALTFTVTIYNTNFLAQSNRVMQ